MMESMDYMHDLISVWESGGFYGSPKRNGYVVW